MKLHSFILPFLALILCQGVVGCQLSSVKPSPSPSPSVRQNSADDTKQTTDFYKLCYFCAYDVFPTVSLSSPEQFWEGYSTSTRPAVLLYIALRQLHGTKPLPEEAAQFRWHQGKLSDGRDYCLVEYPRPPVVALTEEDFEESKEMPKARLLGLFSQFL